MADYSTITLAGGIKEPRHRIADPRPVPAASPAFTAFEQLTEAMSDACAAEEFRLAPASWDNAYSNSDVAAEDAVNMALEAARTAGNAPMVLASDRALIFVARFIHCAIGIENGPDRDNILHLIDESQHLWNSNSARLIARRGNELITRAIEHLSHLMDLLYGSTDHDSATIPGP